MKLRIATSQFAVSSDIRNNAGNILEQMKKAREGDCDLIHFPEGSLSGYAGVDFESFENYPWVVLREATLEILVMAQRLSIWVVLGSAHRLTFPNKPHNCLFIIDDAGRVTDRYDKRFCAGSPDEMDSELLHFSPGNHETVFIVNGIRCGTLICHEYRYPELYRELVKKQVQVVLHSYHAANMDTERRKEMEDQVGAQYHPINPGKTLPEITMPSTMISYAANNHLWISCSNSSAQESCWASMMVRPDGVIHGMLEKNRDGILVTEIDAGIEFYDATRPWRDRAMEGTFHSGRLVNDSRSENRQEL